MEEFEQETLLPGAPKECHAVIYAPSRQRKRFPENTVHVQEDAQAARAGADPARHLYAARVLGPSRSSEGILLYYLMEWLE